MRFTTWSAPTNAFSFTTVAPPSPIPFDNAYNNLLAFSSPGGSPGAPRLVGEQVGQYGMYQGGKPSGELRVLVRAVLFGPCSV
jgi:hypothetical protein